MTKEPGSRRAGAWVVAALAAILLAVTPAATQSPDDPPELQEALRGALRLLSQSKLDEGVAALRAILKDHPDYGLAWGNLGVVLQYQGDLDGAIDAYEHALASDATADTARYNLACAYALKGDADEAFRWLEELQDRGFRGLDALRTDPDLEPLRGDPRFEAVLLRAGAHPRTCEKDPRYAAMDFWVGRWRVVGADGGNLGQSFSVRTLRNCAIVTNWRAFNEDAGNGMSFTYYDPGAGVWRQDRLSDRGDVFHYEGSGRDGVAVFEGTAAAPDGTRERSRMTLEPGEDGSVHQRVEHSRDEGRTWQVVFDGTWLPLGEEGAGGDG
ncbi:MAG: tetratricopeptide repeat protein, partial [Acidobacteriota bacterium]